MRKKVDKTQNLLDEWLDIDRYGKDASLERELVEIAGKRYLFKINGVVTVGPDMLKGEVGERAREMVKKHEIPNYINKKYRKRKVYDVNGKEVEPEDPRGVPRWLPQRFTYFVQDGVVQDTHLWYGGYYANPYVASALAHVVFRKYDSVVRTTEIRKTQSDSELSGVLEVDDKLRVQASRTTRVVRGDVIHRVDGVKVRNRAQLEGAWAAAPDGEVKLELHGGGVRLARGHLKVRKQSKSDEVTTLDGVAVFKQTKQVAASFEAVAEAMRRILGGGTDALTVDDKSVTGGEKLVRDEFIEYLKTNPKMNPALERLRVEDDAASRCGADIGADMEGKLRKAAMTGDPTKIDRVRRAILKRHGNEMPRACLRVIGEATLDSKPAPRAKKKRAPATHNLDDVVVPPEDSTLKSLDDDGTLEMLAKLDHAMPTHPDAAREFAIYAGLTRRSRSWRTPSALASRDR